MIVPNSQFVSERVTNWSRPDKLTAYTLSFHVSHSSDPELVRQVLLAAAAGHCDVLPEPMAEVEFVEVGIGALRFQLQVWTSRTALETEQSGQLSGDSDCSHPKHLPIVSTQIAFGAEAQSNRGHANA